MKPSHVLVALGLAPEWSHGSLRLTLGKENTEEDMDAVIDALPSMISIAGRGGGCQYTAV
jgi:cysteine desulfurase